MAARPAGATILELRADLVFNGEREVLSGIDWTVRQGEHWAIVGPNGSGKSTLLRVAAGELWPSRGRVVLFGKTLGTTDLSELRTAIGIVSTAVAARLPPDLDARTQAATGFAVSIGIGWRGITDEQLRAADAALEAVGARGLADRPYGRLSQGEQQRVLIARALVRKPALLLLDEPCAGLDPVARERFLRDLATLREAPSAPSLVFVTHHLEEIPEFVTHALALREGTSVASGAVDQVLTSKVMSDVFGQDCSVARAGGRWELRTSR